MLENALDESLAKARRVSLRPSVAFGVACCLFVFGLVAGGFAFPRTVTREVVRENRVEVPVDRVKIVEKRVEVPAANPVPADSTDTTSVSRPIASATPRRRTSSTRHSVSRPADSSAPVQAEPQPVVHESASAPAATHSEGAAPAATAGSERPSVVIKSHAKPAATPAPTTHPSTLRF